MAESRAHPDKVLAGMRAYLRNLWPCQQETGGSDMRWLMVLAVPGVLAGCAQGWTPSALMMPGLEIGAASSDPAYAARRGAVELAVKGSWPAIVDEIAAGGGPALTAAMDAAGVPAGDRPTRILQMQQEAASYAANPGALVSALMVYGS
jgi:hypothetical protein